MAPLGSLIEAVLQQAGLSDKVTNPGECKLSMKGKDLDKDLPFRFANIPSGSKITLQTGHERVLGVQDAPPSAPAQQPSSAPPPAAQQQQPAAVSRSEPSKTSTAPPAEIGAVAPVSTAVDRSLHVFTRQAEAEVDSRTTSATPELDEAAYEVTESDARRVLASYAAAKRTADQKHLMTRQMRENEIARKAAAYGHVPVRVEFPDGLVLQASFAATEAIGELKALVKSVLIPEAASCFYLFTTPPKKELKDAEMTFYTAGLVPAARVHVGFRTTEASLQGLTSCLKPEVMALQGEPPARAVAMGKPEVEQPPERPAGEIEEPSRPRPAAAAAEGGPSERRQKAITLVDGRVEETLSPVIRYIIPTDRRDMAPIVSMDTASSLQNGHASWAKTDSEINGANGSTATTATGAAGQVLHFKPEQAAQLFQTMKQEELANLFSANAIIEPPKTPEEAAAWSLAASLIMLSKKDSSFSPDQASHIAMRACSALDTTLLPVLEGGDTPSLSPSNLPSADCVQAMACLAARAATRCDRDGPTPAFITDCLLRNAEQCTALALELGGDTAAGSYVIHLALSTAVNLKHLLEFFAASTHVMVQDVAARMQVLLMAAAQLAEAEYAAHSAKQKHSQKQPTTTSSVLDLWAWRLDQPLDTDLPSDRPALSLARVCTEGAAVLLGAAWCSHPEEIKSAFIPLAMVASEKEAVLLLLGRLLAVLGAEEGACRLIVPMLTDTLAAKAGELEAGVYAMAAHVLAAIAATCAVSGNTWGFSQVVDMLVKLYKFPQFSISTALMYGTFTTVGGSQGAAVEAVLPGTPKPLVQEISGRCPGALAHALQHLAEGLSSATSRFRKDLRIRLLTLFSDFAVLLPNETYLMDLGALLPAVAASMQHFEDPKIADRRMSAVLSSTELSLDTLSHIQEEDRSVNVALRRLWLYSSVYDFASLLQPTPGISPLWPRDWSGALSTIAANTTVLLVGSEQQKPEAFLEHVASEYGGWLTKLGIKGTAPKLMQSMTAAAGQAPGAGQLPAPLAAHILTITYKAVCHAAFQHNALPPEACPVSPVIVHMQYSTPVAAEYPWLRQALEASFETHVSRLSAFTLASNSGDAAYAARAVEETAGVLAESLVPQGPNVDVPQASSSLLQRLIDRFPALLFSQPTIAAALQAVADAECRTPRPTGAEEPSEVSNGTLARSTMLRIVREASMMAPGPAEAVLAEHTRHLSGKGGRHAAIAVRFTPEVMQALDEGRIRSPLPDMSGHYRGIVAWSLKIHALGVITGIEAASEDADVVPQCTRALLEATRHGAPDKVTTNHVVEAAAAIVKHPGSPLVLPAIQLLAWVPLMRFSLLMVQTCSMAWHWLLAAIDNDLQRALREEIANSWMSSQRQGLGLFARWSRGGSEAPMNMDASGDIEQGIAAHHAWIVFFTEVWRSRRHDAATGDYGLQKTFDDVLTSSLGTMEDNPLTIHPASAGARFRLLRLALSYICQSSRADPTRSIGTLQPVEAFRRVILTALAWFAEPVAWYEADREASMESAAAVNDFAQLLRQAPGLIPADPVLKNLNEALRAPDTALLEQLLAAEYERLLLWADPAQAPKGPRSTALSPSQTPPAQWSQMAQIAWTISPRLALSLGSRFEGSLPLTEKIQRLVTSHAGEPAVQALPQAVRYLATPAATAADIPQLVNLSTWAPVSLLQAMSLISTPAGRHPAVSSFLLRSLDSCNPEDVAFFQPQLVQLLRHDPDGAVESFLLNAAQKSPYFAYLLVCQLASEGTPPAEAFNPTVKRSGWTPPTDTGLWSIADRMRQRVWDTLGGPVREHLDAEVAFFGAVTDVSGKLYPIPKEERKSAAVKFLSEIPLPRNDLFMPTDPHATVVKVKPETAAPMQSAAKCPILVAFEVEKRREEDPMGATVSAVKAAIFKVGDDCRQDVLALQVISLLKEQFDSAGLPLPLVPYGVVPTGNECGIIEVVPHAKSRAQLGEVTDGGLFEVFQHEFGLPGSARFEAARSFFISSAAAYAVASYLLQAKDRHNGNIMLDNRGRIIHIDFGYILGISPGGNMGFESAAFKLSYEMTELLDPGNTRASPHFQHFQELCIKGYLAARSMADSIVATVAMMVPSQLPCFGRGAPIDALRQRFHLEMTDAQAADFMRGLINDAYDKWTTGVYDLIQYYQNRIPK